MPKKTSADYQRAFRNRLREQGLKKREVWIRPEHEHLLGEIEERLREAHGASSAMDRNMRKDGWQAEALYQALAAHPVCTGGQARAEMIAGQPSLWVTWRDYGDLPMYLTVAGGQIVIEAVLWEAAAVRDAAAFHEAVLATHKFFPLSTVSLEYAADGRAYYGMFGALSAASALEDIVIEMETLGANVLDAAQAYADFLIWDEGDKA